MNLSLKKLILLSIAIEFVILLVAYFMNPLAEYTFRYAARYSGRFSLLVFLYSFWIFTKSYPKSFITDKNVKKSINIFAVIHLIHFFFLAMSVYLNNIQLEVVKVLGGALAYSMIVFAPFKLDKLSVKFSFIYFYYVSIVMALTYVARIKGDFEGAEPFWFHYIALLVIVLCAIVFGVKIRMKSSKLID